MFYASKIFEIYSEEISDRVLDGENAKGYRRMGMQAAHDLKSPLMSLRHQLRKLESLPKKERETIASSLDTISRITGSLEKDFQNQEEVFMSCKLSDLCEKVVLEKKAEFKDKATLVINYICEPNLEEVTAFIDAVELKRVISNLINNSMQSITLDMEGRITVTLSRKRKYAYVTITDNGRGIPEERIPTLFGRGNTTRRDGKGLGLAHAKETMKVLGGRIELESKVGAGTQVTLLVPVENSEEHSEFTKRNVFTLPTSKARTCVLIDDDKLVAEIWREEAAKADVNLVVFNSPREASTALVKFDKKFTEFYVDVSFGGEVLGPSFARRLRELGFSRVSLSTAYPLSAFDEMSKLGVKVAGKEPPWFQTGIK